MPKESREQLVERASASLSSRELHAYKVWCGSDKPPLAPSLNAKLFQLYLNGKDCEEIRRLNPQLSLGEVAAAKVAGDWEERRQAHLERLLDETTTRVKQATLETADFVCDLLAVASREHGDRLRRYIQTGDPGELGDFRIQSLPALKTAIETLQKLTGQDRQQQLKVTGEVVHRRGEAQKPTSEQAGAVLKLITDQR